MTKPNTVKIIYKLMKILNCFIDKEEISFSELCKITKLSNATVSRILNTLIDGEFINKNQKNGLYSLGKNFFILGFSTIKNLDFNKIIGPILENLANETKETANAAIFFDNKIVYIDIREGLSSVKMSARIGTWGYLHTTALGKAFLAFMNNTKIEEILKNINLIQKTKNTITDKNILRQELMKILKEGYAIDNEEDQIDCKCIASPVFDRNKKVVGCISITGSISRISENESEIIKIIMKYARLASNKLGFYE